ncbi:FAD-dependent monooxygenase [Amycolatopsis nigrescens]|uniref:FAD-dependent monooxygenase n=1 Tax=Amycolatopsis nigrescens TaxID=381445 RepID=UPI00035F4259|nr:FAD-dependent monooxygenase [Amycolatopsis nigrescens]
MQGIETDVIVVGGGPTGLMLACELALAGAGVIVLDRLPERTDQSKALNLQPRTAEVLEQRGLLAMAQDRSLGNVGDGHFAGLPVVYDGWRTRHPYQVGIPQARVEEVLEERLASYGIEVRRGHELTGFTQDEDGVVATVQGPDGELRLRAGYLAGCDGGRSAVRKALGVGFPGIDATEYGVVADVVLAEVPAAVPKRWTSMRDMLRPRGDRQLTAGLLPLGEPGLYRLAYRGENSKPEDPRAPVPQAELEAALLVAYDEEVTVSEVRWASRFGNGSRQAERYRVGRVLLAGDAAHVHAPAGGQGLNLGVQDAMNLGWKLAAEIAGWAPPGLLDSYHDERHPVGARVLENTRAQGVLMDDGPGPFALRKVFAKLMEQPEVTRYLSGMVSGLDIRYPLDGADHELLGARMPDVDLRVAGQDRQASSLLHHGHGVLLTTMARYGEAARPWAGRVDVVPVPELPGFDAAAVLVRPDGYVCWTAATGDSPTEPVKRLEAALTGWFGV